MEMIRLLTLLLVIHSISYSQEIEDQAILFVHENASLEEDQLEDLYRILENPINLNTCTKYDLLQLPFVNSIAAKAIISYRKDKGMFRSVYELQSIQSLQRKTIELLLPFVSTDSKSAISSKHYKHRLLTFFQKNKNYHNGQFKHYLKYSLESKRIKVGVVNEHDAGESITDYNSAYARYDFKNSKIWLGDYDLSLGQGLLIHQGFGFGKSAFSLFKSTPTIKVHRSTREYHFNRGVAFSKKWKKLKFDFWYSNKKVDGSLSETNENQYVRLQTTGYHITESERLSKNNISHFSKGVKLHYHNTNFHASIYSNYNSWQLPVAINTDTIFNQLGIGLDYSLTYKNAHFFGEFATINNKGAYINGCNIHLSPRLTYSFLIRNISPDYHSFQANAFVENSNVTNELGFFSSFTVKLNSKWSLIYFLDNFKTKPVARLSEHALIGTEHFIDLKHKWSKKNRLEWRWQYKSEQNLNNNDFGLDQSYFNKQIKYRCQAIYSLGDFHFKSRIQYNLVDSLSGQLFFQEVAYNPLDSKWTCKLRYVFYDTDSYASRVYSYEPDVLYAFTIPAYYDKGQAIIFTFKYKLSRKLTSYFKIKSDQSSSLFNENDSKLEFKCLLKWQF